MKNLINNVNRKLGRKSRKGFSLVELLVVIAVIGVIAAIAIPAMSGVFENSNKAKAKRNAQNVASLYSSMRAAGAVVATPDVDKIVAALQTGVNGVGPFATTKFKSNLPTTEEAATKLALAYDAASDSLTVNQTY